MKLEAPEIFIEFDQQYLSCISTKDKPIFVGNLGGGTAYRVQIKPLRNGHFEAHFRVCDVLRVGDTFDATPILSHAFLKRRYLPDTNQPLGKEKQGRLVQVPDKSANKQRTYGGLHVNWEHDLEHMAHFREGWRVERPGSAWAYAPDKPDEKDLFKEAKRLERERSERERKKPDYFEDYRIPGVVEFYNLQGRKFSRKFSIISNLGERTIRSEMGFVK